MTHTRYNYMALAVPKTVVQGLAIYNLTPEKSLPEWYASTKKKGNLRHNEGTCRQRNDDDDGHEVDFRRRIELIQGFEFPGAATRVKYSPNGKFIAACGMSYLRTVTTIIKQVSTLPRSRCLT